MSIGVQQHEVVARFVALQAAVAEAVECDLSVLAEDELLEVVRLAERARRQLEAVDHVTVPQLEARNVPGRHLARSTGAFLAQLLNLAPAEAHARVRQAREFGSQTTLLGEQLPPKLPLLAAAREAGTVTARHASVVIEAVGRLASSDKITPDQLGEAEAYLVEHAETFDPVALSGLARRLIDTLDPDGTLADEAAQQRRRKLSLTPIGDGMHRIAGDLDAETSAMAMAVLHSLAAPKPDTTTHTDTDTDTDAHADTGPGERGERDERTAGQRLHDAFGTVMRMALQAGTLPRTGGIPATVLITMTAEQFETGTGLASTSFGQKLTVPQALRLADEASIGWLVHNSSGGIVNHGRRFRLATHTQTLALIARDQGCSFPGCADPPEWTQKHHVIPWRDGGPTDLENLVMICGHHHRHIDTGGWTIHMRDGIPWYTPPSWIDPTQKPRRNERR